MRTITEENYLSAIYKLEQSGDHAVSTNAIADEVGTKAATVTDMLKRLSENKLIKYKKYQGVSLTTKGHEIALGIVRNHRLWECFLVDTLKFNWDEVHEIAEELEHVRFAKLTERLDQFLGHPKFDPHGDPIPSGSGKMADRKGVFLSELKPETNAVILGAGDQSSSFLKYLSKIGLTPGAIVRVSEIAEYDKSILLKIHSKTKITVSRDVAKNILVAQNHEKRS